MRQFLNISALSLQLADLLGLRLLRVARI